MQAVGYARLSTHDQDLDIQIQEIKRFTDYRNIDLLHIYAEKASGANTDRPEFSKVKEMDETFDIIKAGAADAPPEQALYRIQHTYSDGSGARLNVDWEGLLQLHELIHDRIALEGRVCETCGTKGCHRPATWEIECRGAGVSGRLIYVCDEHAPDEAILSPQDEIRRLVER